MKFNPVTDSHLSNKYSLRVLLMILAVTLATIFFSELAIMYALPHLLPKEVDESVEALLDSSLLTLALGSIILPLMLAYRKRLLREGQRALRLRFVLDEHAIVSITDVTGNITYANQRFCDISGYTRKELLGENHRLIKSDEHPPAVFRDMWRTIAAGKIWRGDVRNRNKAGGYYWVHATIVPFMNEKGKPEEYVSIRTEISEQKLLQKNLAAALETAESASEAKSDFLSSMSHELRTPMNAILGFAQMLECDSELTADQQDNVHEILKGGHHLLKLINEVLDLAKVESGHIELSLEPVFLDALVAECHQLIQPLAATRRITLFLEVSHRMVVRGDRVRLKQVLLNLLSNAVKYNREGGDVRLGAQTVAGERLRITVTDTGAGIAPERMTELFQPFNRLNAENSGIEGTGIGLTITRRLVELMGGEVGVDSQVGVGTAFWIELPDVSLASIVSDETRSAADDVATADDFSLQPSAAATNQHKLLCVDDNPVNIKLVAQVLGKHRQFHLLTAHTPQLGIELALAHRPDLILLDINMPGMDGYQVLQILRADERTKSIPVIAVTANAMNRDIERGRAAGFAEYVTKPLHVGQFLKAIDQCLAEGEGTRE